VRRVLDHREVGGRGDLVERGQVGGMSMDVHGKDAADRRRAATFRHDSLDLIGIDAQGVGFDVHEKRSRADLLDHLDAGTEGHRCGYDGVTGADAEG
jgi:hypothetical protein